MDTSIPYESGTKRITRTSTTTTTYLVQGAGPFMALPTTTQSVTNDSNVATPVASTSSQRAFDAYGNVTGERDVWPLDSEERATTTTYQNSTNGWLIGLPTYVSVTSTTASAEAMTREVAFTYDSLGSSRFASTIRETQTVPRTIRFRPRATAS